MAAVVIGPSEGLPDVADLADALSDALNKTITARVSLVVEEPLVATARRVLGLVACGDDDADDAAAPETGAITAPDAPCLRSPTTVSPGPTDIATQLAAAIVRPPAITATVIRQLRRDRLDVLFEIRCHARSEGAAESGKEDWKESCDR